MTRNHRPFLKLVPAAISVFACLEAVAAEGLRYEVLYEFFPYPEGRYPNALIQARDGSFYGTTESGGASDLGTIFKLDLKGVVTTFHSFAGSDGDSPCAALIQASDGSFYGTTYGGGASGQGTIFKLDPHGTFSTIHSFGGDDA